MKEVVKQVSKVKTNSFKDSTINILLNAFIVTFSFLIADQISEIIIEVVKGILTLELLIIHLAVFITSVAVTLLLILLEYRIAKRVVR